MKLNKILIGLLSCVAFISCDMPDETTFDSYTKNVDLNANSNRYFQFANSTQSLKTEVSDEGGIIEIETNIDVVILGTPSSEDISVNIAIDESNTEISSDMYTLSSNEITILKGETSGSITLTTIAVNMPVDEELKFVMTLDMGDQNASKGTTLNYTLKRSAFCPLTDSANDFVGSWSGIDNASEVNTATYPITKELVAGDAGIVTIDGLGFGWLTDPGYWGETIVDGTEKSTKLTVNGNGTITIDEQDLVTTLYSGSEYEYTIKGSGEWQNCGDKAVITLSYELITGGSSYGPFTAEITMN